MYSNKNSEDNRFRDTADSLVMLEETKKLHKQMIKPETNDKRVVIPIGVIDDEENIRASIEENDGFHALVASIEKLGLLQPLVVTPYKGKIKLVSGHRRLKAIRKLKWKNVAVINKHIDYAKDFTLAQLVENVNREELAPIDHAEAMLALKETGNYSNKEVGKIVGSHEKQINILVNIAKMPHEAKEFSRAHNLTITQLRSVVKTREGKDPKKIMSLLMSLTEGNASKADDKKDLSNEKRRSSSEIPVAVRDWVSTKGEIPRITARRLEKIGRIIFQMDEKERNMALELCKNLPCVEGVDDSLA